MTDSPENTIPFITPDEMRRRGFQSADFVLVSGDAYVDHPSFGAAIIARVLQKRGYTVGVLAQPDWHSADAFRALGRPKLAFLVTGGNIDSMVNHYTAARKPRSEDAYTPGGRAGARPDRAAIVYGNRCREAYSGVPVILGGIEASLRRFAHYDYWDDKVRHSILYDAGADILLYGMAERSVVQVADALAANRDVRSVTGVRGVCYRVDKPEDVPDAVILPSFTEVSQSKRRYAEAFMAEEREHDAVRGRALVQPHEKGCLVVNPPQPPLTAEELDAIYALPFTRRAHPSCRAHVPALDEVSFSIASARGCFGGCSFCALTFHQGRVVQARSHASILAEAKLLTLDPAFRGVIHDVGGPTANFRQPACKKQLTVGVCADKQCIGYERCQNLVADESDYTALLKKLRALPGVRRVFVRSGVRYDYALYDKSDAFLSELVRHHVSGQLKVAPEHVSDRVLYYMNKPPRAVFERFTEAYARLNRRFGLDQYLVPYLISSHPGSELSDAIELALYLKENRMRPEQVQDFYPTPGTLSTCMFYTGLDPRTMEPVYVPKSPEEKRMQRALLQYYEPKNFALVRRTLERAGRSDLIGFGRGCLVPPPREEAKPAANAAHTGAKRGKNAVDKRRRNR